MDGALPWAWIILALLTLQRVVELGVARRNTARLVAQGGQEVGAAHYPLIVLLHAAWLLALWVMVPKNSDLVMPALIAAVLLQFLRYWVISTLGPYWTTRIITVPDAPLVRRGPYRFLKHPNYVVVVLEIAIVPLIFAAWEIALVFSVLNAVVLTIRIRAENAALQDRLSGE